jgi:uncharacterized protein YecE (DUF72 family)
MLQFYAGRFHTVEINNSFYHLPQKEVFEQWRETTPQDFLFAVKASRYITHMKKLKDPEEPVRSFLDNVRGLGEKLGPILFQLPPRWHANVERLVAFLKVLPARLRYTFEFRDSSWFIEPVYQALEDNHAAFCIYQLNRELSPKKITADFVYVRLHGPDGAYQGQYSQEALADWARSFRDWSQRGKDIYCYFDNDQAGYAAQDASRLIELVSEGT